MRSKWRGEGKAGDDRGEDQAQAIMEWQVGVAGSEGAKGLGLLAGHQFVPTVAPCHTRLFVCCS